MFARLVITLKHNAGKIVRGLEGRAGLEPAQNLSSDFVFLQAAKTYNQNDLVVPIPLQ